MNNNKPRFIYTENGIKSSIPRYYRVKLLQLYGYDISTAYIQRKTTIQRIVNDKTLSNDFVSRVINNRNISEIQKENKNLHKSKNKRK